MNHTVKMASDGLIYTPSFKKIASGIQIILRLSARQFAKL
jgi:hypothetical protein